MSSERIVMGDAPEKKSKKGLMFTLLGIILAVLVLVLLFKPFKKGTDKMEQPIAQEVVTEEAVSEPVSDPETSVQETPSEAKDVGTVVPEKEKEVEIVPANQNKIHTVIKGECLWKIAEIEYNDPFKWAAIYKANTDQIKDSNLIYPNQKFIIP